MTHLKFIGAIWSCTNTTTIVWKQEHIKSFLNRYLLNMSPNRRLSPKEPAVPTLCQLVARSDISFRSLFSIIDVNNVVAKQFNKQIRLGKRNSDSKLNFVILDGLSLRIAVFSDKSFAGNADLSSQPGFLVTIVDKKHTANVVHSSSFDLKRVTASVLAIEFFSVVHAFHFASTVRKVVNNMIGGKVSLTIYRGSKSLFEGLVCINSTMQKQRMINLRMLR